MTQKKIQFVEDLLQFTESLYSGILKNEFNRVKPQISFRARVILEKHLEILKETEKLGKRDPSFARVIAQNEAELHWAINRIEDVLMINH